MTEKTNLFHKFTVILLSNGIDEIKKCLCKIHNYFLQKNLQIEKKFHKKAYKIVQKSYDLWAIPCHIIQAVSPTMVSDFNEKNFYTCFHLSYE